MSLKPFNNQKRSGFTLLELLIVVAIIGLLMTLTLAVMSGITEQAEEEATKTTVLKVSRLLENRIEAFERAFKGSKRDQYITATIGLLHALDARFDHFLQHPDEAPPAIRLLAYKAGFRYEIPQRMIELNVLGNSIGDHFGGSPPPGLSGAVRKTALTDPPGMPNFIYFKAARPVAVAQLIAAGTANPSETEINTQVSVNWDTHLAYEARARASQTDDFHSTESAELLYFMLFQSGTFGSASANADQFTSSEIQDTDGDGFPEIVDAWGHPLQFYRWPTRLFDPTAPAPFAPDFATVNDPTEVDPTPDDDESDGLREILSSERIYAGLLVKGLPPSPSAIGSATQRDMMLVDPDDPVGILYTFLEDPYYKNLGIDLTLEYNEGLYHTPDTYHVPLIVSCGPDERLGLYEPNNTVIGTYYGNLAQYAGTTVTAPLPSTTVVDHLFDNITNRNRRAGSRR